MVDSPELEDVERLECSWSMSKRFCCGIDHERHRLLIARISSEGVESYQWINQTLVGLPNILTQPDDTVICYVENNSSQLLSIIINPNETDSINIHQRGTISKSDS